jgi:opacity protein-like surface antigen
MKKVTLLIGLAAFLFASSINAQSKKNEIDLGIGVWSSSEIVGTLSDVIVSNLTQVKMENKKYIGAIHAGYKYAVSNRFALGPVFTYDRGTSTSDVPFRDELGNDIGYGKFTSNYYSLALEGDYKYINSDKFKLYSLVGVGPTFLNQSFKEDNSSEDKSQSKTFFNYQVTPIGIKYGDSFGVFAELGFGYKGILCAGVFYRF